jgi:uncharacterized protein (DUF362 family)
MGNESDPKNRRHALIQMLRLGGLATATTGVGYWLSARSQHPEASEVAAFEGHKSIPNDPNLPELVVAHGDDPRLLVRKSIEGLGGIKRFIAQGDMVLIKPNIGWDRTPEQAANTNPQAVAEMVKLCREAGAKRVMVADVSCNEARRCYQRSGIAEAATAEGAEVILPDSRNFKRIDMKRSLGSWQVLEPFLAADKVVNFPIAKNHELAGLTLGMKNWLGIVGGSRNWLHQDIHRSVVDLADFARPALTIIDAYRILVRNGPTGGSLSDVAVTKTLIAATDPVAADSYAAQAFWKLDSSSLPFLKIATDRGLGNKNFAKVRTRFMSLGG